MNRRLSPGSLLLLLVMAITPLACDYGGTKAKGARGSAIGALPKSRLTPPSAAGSVAPIAIERKVSVVDDQEQRDKREAILQNVMRLIEKAKTTPGDQSFAIATQNLNQYFEVGTQPSDYEMTPGAREFIKSNIDEKMVPMLERPGFGMIDARHIEDCMLYNTIATRISGEGDDLSRAKRLFDYMIRQVQLIPPQSLATPTIQQAQARPYDVLLRGMATEANDGFWTERGWLFMSLLRQAGIDSGLVSYMPIRPPSLIAAAPDAAPPDQPVVFATAVLVDGKAYLFDHRIGLTIPDASGKGIATLEDAMTNPDILGRLDLPGQSSYGITRANLLASTSKITVYLDSSRGYFSPKMRLLQARLAGKDRTILFREVSEVAAKFREALGARIGDVKLWSIPMIVENELFTNPQFVESTQYALRLFDNRLPLLFARVAQLKGNTAEAIESYVSLRFATGAVMRNKEKTPIPPGIQRELDIYATYFLGLAQLEQKNTEQAERLFSQLLNITPAPSPSREYCFMFRWGANTNLGLINLERGNNAMATRYLSEGDIPSFASRQVHGNLWLARELVWRDPFAAPGAALPPAPPRVDAGTEQQPAAVGQ